MPMPTPNTGETQDDFISRCMGDEVMVGDYPDNAQRAAVCHSQWGSGNNARFAKSYELTAEVFAVGRWNGLDFTAEDLMSIASAFHSLGDNHRVPVKFGHNGDQPLTDGQPALGWITDVWFDRQTEKLMVKISDMPEVVYSAVQAKLYRNVSIELDFGVEHKGQYYPMVLSGVALLGADIPAVNTLADLTSYMERESIGFSKREGTVCFSVSNVDVTKHEDTHMADPNDKVTLENLNATIQAMKSEQEKQAVNFSTLQAENAELKAKLKAKDEVEAHRKQTEQRTSLFAKLEKMVTEEKITPATRDEYERDYDNATKAVEKDMIVFAVEKLEKTIEANPEYFGAEQARQKGERERNEADKTADKILLSRTNEYMVKHGEKDFSRAKLAVMRADPDLAERYAKQMEA